MIQGSSATVQESDTVQESATVQASAAHQTSAMIQGSASADQNAGQKSSSNPQSTPLPITIHGSPENKIKDEQKDKAEGESNQNLLYLLLLAPVMGAVSCYLQLRNQAQMVTSDVRVMGEIVVGEGDQNQSQDLAPINEDNRNQSQDSDPSSSQTAEWVSFGDDEESENQVLPNPDPSRLSSSNSSLALRSVSTNIGSNKLKYY